MAILDKPQLFSIALGRRFQHINRLLRAGLTSLTGYTAYVPEHIEFAPGSLETADPYKAEEFYRGLYFLDGELIESGTISPFLIENTPVHWQKALHEFGWLRHLSARNDALSAIHARTMISDWINAGPEVDREISWDTFVAARRLIYLLSNSDMILSGATYDFYTTFMQNIGTHLRFLKRHAQTTPAGLPRLTAYLALCYASVCCPSRSELLAFSHERLDFELEQQVLPDGGHVSRNPEIIVTVLSLLLPYRHVCSSAGVQVSSTLVSAIERMLPALRGFRMGDGTLARFNGTSVVESDLMATLTRYDESLGEPVSSSTSSGYQRLSIDQTVALMDVGNPPAGDLSGLAHAGCLSFEFSSQKSCIVVNCGAPVFSDERKPSVWRTTAAHSTAAFGDVSFCRFENRTPGIEKLDGLILTTNLQAEYARDETADGVTVTASHLGYGREFGARHQRTLGLDQGGARLRGSDWFSTPEKAELRYTIDDAVSIRFHLHPDVSVRAAAAVEKALLLETKSGERWRFSCNEVNPELEESIFFANITGSRRTTQIVLRVAAESTPVVNWAFRRAD